MQKALRGRVLTFDSPETYRYWPDGAIVIEGGLIISVGEASALPPGLPTEHFPGKLLLPGLIDAHIHYPQTGVIASYGTQLLDWLNRYTFPAEQSLRDPAIAAGIARFFLDELLRNGTTTAAVYCTVHPESAEAFFTESARRNTRMIAGKVLMDRNAPPGLIDTAETGRAESQALIESWHGKGRQLYAITPRFALTSTEAQLEAAGELMKQNPTCYVQTHLSENHAEIAAVRALFPQASSYTDVYDRYGLLTDRTLLGHCIHLDQAEIETLAARRAVTVFCPTSNLFLGSGLFDMARLRAGGVRLGVATDVGGGTSYSMLRTAADGYKVLQLRGQTWPACAAFHAITRGNAAALHLQDRIGSLAPGFEADIIVLDAGATPAMAHRLARVENLEEELFLLLTLGDDRCVTATYVAGGRVVL